MTLKIEVFVPENDVRTGEAGKYIDTAFSAIGFYRRGLLSFATAEEAAIAGLPVGAALGAAVGGAIVKHERTDTAATVEQAVAREVAEGDADPEGTAQLNNPQVFSNTKRERGKPSPGRQRRTKEEIAEDEAAERALAGVDADLKEIVADTNANVPTDDAATAEQDKADEVAERELQPATLTLDDLRAAVGAYQRTYGMKAVTADVPQLLGKKMIEVTEDELAPAIETVKQATDDNPFGRAVVGTEATQATAKPEEKQQEKQPPAATKDDVRAALMDYALRYDGQNTDQKKMPFTMEDGARVLIMLFGEEVTGAGKIPPSPENYAKAVAGIREMIAKDPFKRGGKGGV